MTKARLLVEIDDELKRELKIRLLREGETLKSWLTRMAAAYVGATPRAAVARSPTPRSAATTPGPAVRAASPTTTIAAPQPHTARTSRRHDDYLD